MTFTEFAETQTVKHSEKCCNKCYNYYFNTFHIPYYKRYCNTFSTKVLVLLLQYFVVSVVNNPGRHHRLTEQAKLSHIVRFVDNLYG